MVWESGDAAACACARRIRAAHLHGQWPADKAHNQRGRCPITAHDV